MLRRYAKETITMKKVIVRVGIVACGLLCVGFAGLIVFLGDTDHYEELDSLSKRLDADPSPKHLRDLLNYPADGAYSYYQMALIGASFSKHPGIFRVVCEDLQTAQESRSVERLAALGGGVFEYHPELKPSAFDHRFRDQNWLTPTQVEQDGAGQPPTRSKSQ